MKRVEVRWHDSVGVNLGWAPKMDYDRPFRRRPQEMRTIGYLVRQNKHVVSVACSRHVRNGNLDYLMVIPRSCVVSVKRLR